MYSANLAIHRILTDLDDLDKNPLQGVSLDVPDLTDPYTLHANIEIQDGFYKGILIHLIFHIPTDYPNSPPAVNIAPGLNFNRHHHTHIFDDYTHGHWICTGITTNYADVVKKDSANIMSRLSRMTAWTSGYMLGSILMHLQVLLSNPEFPRGVAPSAETLQKLKEHIKQYKLQVKAHNGTKHFYATHSYNAPYPFLTLNHTKELQTSSEKLDLKINSQSLYGSTVNCTSKNIIKELSNKLVCSVTKLNIFHRSQPVLGYPIDMRRDRFDRFWPNPVIELLSYEAFAMNLQQTSQKLDDFDEVSFKSGLGNSYNYWLPIYIDQNHFERSKSHILNAISVMYRGIEGKEENDFSPHMVLKVLPPILVKTAVQFLKGTLHQSVASIEAYCQIYRLLVKLVELYPKLKEMIDLEVLNFVLHESNRHKSEAGDLGEFIIKLSLSSVGIANENANNLVLKEFLARQVSWAIQKDKGLAFGIRCPNFVERFSKATEISEQFVLTMIETAKLMLNDEISGELEERCGILNDDAMRLFRSKLEWIQGNVGKDWKMFVKEFGQEKFIPDGKMMFRYLEDAFVMARMKGYQY